MLYNVYRDSCCVLRVTPHTHRCVLPLYIGRASLDKDKAASSSRVNNQASGPTHRVPDRVK